MHKQISSVPGQRIHLQAWIPNLAMTLLMNIKGEFSANVLMMKKNQVTLKQTWIAEIGFKVLYYSI